MDQQKCRICGDRHRLGPCPDAAAPRRGVISNKRAISYPIELVESFAEPPKPPKAPARKRAKAVEGLTQVAHHLRSLAPEGVCPYCDYRRVAAARSMRTRRAKDKKAKRRAKRKDAT